MHPIYKRISVIKHQYIVKLLIFMYLNSNTYGRKNEGNYIWFVFWVVNANWLHPRVHPKLLAAISKKWRIEAQAAYFEKQSSRLY